MEAEQNPFHTGRSLDTPNYLDDLISRFVPQQRVCIQAGGHKGAWPYHLARYFETVYTFEPFLENFIDLASSGSMIPKFNYPLPENVFPFRAGLYAGTGRSLFQMAGKNRKKGHMIPGGGYYPIVSIDGIAPRHGVDLICLDIEGCELEALIGAFRTLEQQRPVLCIEINKCKQSPNQLHYKTTVPDVLSIIPAGYRQVETYGLDAVFVYG